MEDPNNKCPNQRAASLPHIYFCVVPKLFDMICSMAPLPVEDLHYKGIILQASSGNRHTSMLPEVLSIGSAVFAQLTCVPSIHTTSDGH